MQNKFIALVVEEEGQSLVEYGLILGLVSVLLVGALTAMKDSLNEIFGKVQTELTNAASGGSKKKGGR
jgi:pilus assembly protein Flp/PilA